MSEFNRNIQLWGVLGQKSYTWNMARHKTRIGPAAKAKMLLEAEDAVLALAEAILRQRKELNETVPT